MSTSVRSRLTVPSASSTAEADESSPANNGSSPPRGQWQQQHHHHDAKSSPGGSRRGRGGGRAPLAGGRRCSRVAFVSVVATTMAGLYALLSSRDGDGGVTTVGRRRRDEQLEQRGQQLGGGAETTRSSMTTPMKLSAEGGGGGTSLDDCGIAIHSIDSEEASGGAGSRSPVLLRGWNFPQSKLNDGRDGHDGSMMMNWTDVDTFLERFGRHMQYVKDATVQPRLRKRSSTSTTSDEELCRVPGADLWRYVTAPKLQSVDPLWFFTNDRENSHFLSEIRNHVPPTPTYLRHVDGFHVFSALTEGGYHSFHQHGESWIGQLSGSKMWWFLPPDTKPKPSKVDACGYLRGEGSEMPEGAVRCLQRPGDVIWFPKDWYHATCALDAWTVGFGAQVGPLIRQNFPPLDQTKDVGGDDGMKEMIEECLGVVPKDGGGGDEGGSNGVGEVAPVAVSTGKTKDVLPEGKPNANAKAGKDGKKKDDGEWTWFDGDINAYYNSLEKDHKRNPQKINDYAVHRWMGPRRSTEIHYQLLDKAVERHLNLPPSESDTEGEKGRALEVLDAGCGLGSALMWLENERPSWNLVGHTLSEEQHRFIVEKLPQHRFIVNLRSYDDLDDGKKFDVIYSIEAAIHSPDLGRTLSVWADHLSEDGGVVVLIDDFLQVGAVDAAKNDDDDPEIDYFRRSWLANSLVTTTQLHKMGRKVGLTLVEDRDLGSEYRINELNYGNRAPEIKVDGNKSHQGWLGSKMRQRLMILGKLTYRMVVLQKGEPRKPPPAGIAAKTTAAASAASCSSVPSKEKDDDAGATFKEITPQLMSGVGKDGGDKMACISGWYCCDKGIEWYDDLESHRTDSTKFLKLPRGLFERHYVDVFADRLNEHYRKYPSSSADAAGGRFLDIGGTGSTASGMTQVTSKFQHFAGPLEYWKLDSDPAAKKLERTLHCDVDDCPSAEDCAFDVTFSHMVLEHARRPWKSFDTVARITKRGGLTLHLVPFSYQYHATPEDNFRFSHTALASLVEDRGFEVLDLGYDLCTKPDAVLRSRRDEHYDTIWLTYVVARKL